MKRIFLVLTVVVISIAAGCQRTQPDKPRQGSQGASDSQSSADAEIKKSLAKLSPEDRQLAESQKFCAVQGKKSRLGSMGTPVKVTLNGEPVFLCCEHCTKKAQDHPEETLARAKEFRSAK
jgi:hypothetical protein